MRCWYRKNREWCPETERCGGGKNEDKIKCVLRDKGHTAKGTDPRQNGS